MNNRQEVKVTFSKRGDLRFMSHRNVASLLERAARRAEMPVAFSEGFNPRPKISFPCALETGIASDCEVVFMQLTQNCDEGKLADRLSNQLPEGIAVRDVVRSASGMPRKATSMRYEVDLPEELAIGQEELNEACRNGTVERTRTSGTKSVQLSRYVREMHLDGRKLIMDVSLDESGSLRPREVLESIGVKDSLSLNVRRTHVELS